MITNYKCIALDLDGTLLTKENQVSKHNRDVLLTCIERDIEIYLVTGRPYCFAKHIAQKIDARIKVISANGGIYEIENDILEKAIQKNRLIEIIEVIQKYNVHAFFKGRHEFYTHEPYDKRFLYDHMNDLYSESNRVHSYTDLAWDELKEKAHDITKILVYHMDEVLLQKVRKKIECIQVEVTDYHRISFDITANHINKGNVIKLVSKKLGYLKEEWVAIGDANNDIAMFKEAGLCIAMGNATKEVKKYCDYITDDYEHDGVAKAIEAYVL